jgi:hypothetical protein
LDKQKNAANRVYVKQSEKLPVKTTGPLRNPTPNRDPKEPPSRGWSHRENPLGPGNSLGQKGLSCPLKQTYQCPGEKASANLMWTVDKV